MICTILSRFSISFGSILCLLCVIQFVGGLYEKDIGKRDLYFQNVGIVQTARFHISPQRKRTFVGSTDNVVASFNLKSSKIGWRYVFPEDEPLDILEQSSQGLLCVTGRRHVSLFTLDGYLTWDTVLQPKPSTWIDALFIPDPAETGRDIAILFNNSIQFRSSKDGTILDTLVSVPEEDFSMYKLHVHESMLYAFGGVSSSESSQAILQIDLNSNTTPKGKFIKNLFVGLKIEKPQQLPLLVDGYLLALNREGDHILLNHLGKKDVDTFKLTELLTSPEIKQAIGTSSIHLQRLDEDHTVNNPKSKGETDPDEDPVDPTDSADTLSDTVSRTATAFLVTTDGGTRALFSLKTLGGSETIQFLKLLQKNEAVSSVTYVGDKALVATIQGKTLTLFDVSKTESGTTPLTFDLPIWNSVARDLHSQEWNIDRLWLKSVSKNDGSHLHHLLASGKDGGLGMLSWTAHATLSTGSSPVGLRWKREEALSQVIQTQFIDFPVDRSMLEELTNEFSSDGVIRRIVSHTTVLFQHMFQTMVNVPSVFSSFVAHTSSGSYSKALDSLMGTETEDADLDLRDRFGYTKLILVITGVGKVLGMHSKTGEIKWDRYYPNQQLKHIFSVKKSVSDPPEVVLLGLSPDNHWWLSVINPLTGDESAFLQLDYQVKHTLLLPNPDDHHCAILLLFDTQDRVHLYPNTPRTRDILSESGRNIFFYIHDSSAETVTGYGVSAPPSPAIPRARVLWRKVWSGSSESIVTVSSGSVNAHAPAHVLGDNSVLWKYLNPNLVIVGTTTNSAEVRNSEDDDSENSAENFSVTIYVMDIVTGHVVHRTQYRHATSPLHVVHAENWIVCYFWNTKSYAFQISTEELFRGPDWNGEKFSSFAEADVPLEVLKNSYLFTSSVRTMAVTTTTRGITNKQILLGLSSGQVVSLDKRYVDARRPVRAGNRPTMEDQMEGIIPYYPIFDVNPLWFISYNLSIPLLRSIHTAPTQLESTTLVLCHGLDLFYVAMSGSNVYDRLDPNLNRSAILLLLGVLVLMWVLASHLAKRSALKASWK